MFELSQGASLAAGAKEVSTEEEVNACLDSLYANVKHHFLQFRESLKSLSE